MDVLYPEKFSNICVHRTHSGSMMPVPQIKNKLDTMKSLKLMVVGHCGTEQPNLPIINYESWEM